MGSLVMNAAMFSGRTFARPGVSRIGAADTEKKEL